MDEWSKPPEVTNSARFIWAVSVELSHLLSPLRAQSITTPLPLALGTGVIPVYMPIRECCSDLPERYPAMPLNNAHFGRGFD